MFEKRYIAIIPSVLLFGILTIISWNYCYFWDNIQQISKEAHLYYDANFSGLINNNTTTNLEIKHTGYHSPALGITTALLWKVVGYKLWVSHVLSFLFAVFFVTNLYHIVKLYIPSQYVSFAIILLVCEPTILSQFVIASPDFILLTAFTITLRAIIENKSILLIIGILILFSISIRGLFAGLLIMFVHLFSDYYFSKHNNIKKTKFSTFIHYLPAIICLTAYYVNYFYVNGWFFTNSAYSSHYEQPTTLTLVIRHAAEFVLRLVENGRIAFWVLAFYFIFSIKKFQTPQKNTFLLLFVALATFSLYVLFIFTTKMPFSARYFLPFYLIVSIFVISQITYKYNRKTVSILFIFLFICEVTGNFWIYPNKIAKSWDTTLAHISYYDVRKECFDYIDFHKYDYNKISAGFCLYDKRKYVELNSNNKIIGNATNEYFLYSNISNLEDSLEEELNNPQKWTQIKEFKSGFVFIKLMRQKIK